MGESAFMTYFAHLRASNVGADFSSWKKTKNPHLQDLVGIFDGNSDSSVDVRDILGFEATFACGTRVAMHDLPVDFPSLSGSFRECVTSGVATNKELKRRFLNAPFL